MIVWKRLSHPWSEYEISDAGGLRRYSDRRPMKTYAGGRGYREARLLNSDGVKARIYIHRKVCKLFMATRPTERHEVAHNDGDRMNARVKNLRWATPSENQMDRVDHGTSNRGSRHGMARLNEINAKAILQSDEPGCVLAKRFNVSQQTICDLRKGRTWAHLRKVA